MFAVPCPLGLCQTARAEDGSLLLGDLVTRAGKQEVRSTDAPIAAPERKKPGEMVALEVLRNESPIRVVVKLSAAL